MPINPIDLQANFTQINHIGRQQSNVKDSEQVKELQINLLVQKESEENSDDIPITKDLSEGAGRIKDEESNKKRKKKDSEDKKEDENKNAKEEKDKSDSTLNPILGNRIDIIG